jgi:hypothetical protein
MQGKLESRSWFPWLADRHAKQARIKEFVSMVSRLRTYILDVIGILWD